MSLSSLDGQFGSIWPSQWELRKALLDQVSGSIPQIPCRAPRPSLTCVLSLFTCTKWCFLVDRNRRFTLAKTMQASHSQSNCFSDERDRASSLSFPSFLNTPFLRCLTKGCVWQSVPWPWLWYLPLLPELEHWPPLGSRPYSQELCTGTPVAKRAT